MFNKLQNRVLKSNKIDQALANRIVNIEAYIKLVEKRTGIPFKNVIVKNKVA